MYNIYLISTDTFEAIKVIKSNVSMSEASFLEKEEQKKYNIVDFYVAGFEVGSSEDIKHSKSCQK